MELILLGAFEINDEDINSVSCIQYKNMKIWLGKEQKFELSESKKTIYIIQYDNNKEIGRKGFRVASCLFFTEINE